MDTSVPLSQMLSTLDLAIQRNLLHEMKQYCSLLQFLFEAATANCIDLATDRHGCCVLQKCLGHSDGEPRRRLVCKITSHALLLSQDPYGYSFFPRSFSLTIVSSLFHT